MDTQSFISLLSAKAMNFLFFEKLTPLGGSILGFLMKAVAAYSTKFHTVTLKLKSLKARTYLESGAQIAAPRPATFSSILPFHPSC